MKISKTRAVVFVMLLSISSTFFACQKSAETKLSGTKWEVKELSTSDVKIEEIAAGSLTLEFISDSTFGAKSLCNSIAGDYKKLEEAKLSLSTTAVTTALCPHDTLESIYIEQLNLADSYKFAGDTLILEAEDNLGGMRLLPLEK